MTGWLVAGAVLLVALAGCAAWQVERRRRARLRAFAAGRGWRYAARDDAPLGRWRGAPFGQGSERRCRHVLSGSHHGRSCTVFEFEYVTYSNDAQGNRQRHVHRDMIAAVDLPRVLPWVQVTREGLLHRIGHALGFDDIELESEEFNRRFRVTAADRRLACDVLHPRMMELLLAAGGPPWRIENGALLCWDRGRLRLDEVDPMLDFCRSVVDRIPAFVWSAP